MRRRSFISLAAAALGSPGPAFSQQARHHTIGFLHSASAAGSGHLIASLRKGLGEQGFHEGRNLTIHYAWADGAYDRLPGLARDLIARSVAVMLAVSDPAALAAQAATRTIPIVFNTGTDPEQLGLITKLNRPGGNLTGVSQLNNDLAAKRFEMLRELVPTAHSVGYLVNASNPNAVSSIDGVQAAARALGVEIAVLSAHDESALRRTFEAIAERRIGALLIGSDPLFLSRRLLIVDLAAAVRLPTFYTIREYVDAGGLISYSASRAHLYHLTGTYVGQILKGAQPADLPVQQPTRFELIINLKTAKALGLEVPPMLLARADEVIE